MSTMNFIHMLMGGLSFYQPRIGFTNSSSNADVSTAGLQSSSGETPNTSKTLMSALKKTAAQQSKHRHLMMSL